MSISLQRLLKPLIINTILLRERYQSGVTYNPLSHHVFTDPYPTYATLRTRDPVLGWCRVTRILMSFCATTGAFQAILKIGRN
ncbi:hypothetical protein [Candidatus Entotheonella palauensis]|uniref:hypothetical protein n=1 Tax=Candidatus Entotheonella palauensis TaxID=93172 RepID=UPI0015C4BDBC|nr:hypothetical protein [Candidatus Entotheonella palauensis]